MTNLEKYQSMNLEKFAAWLYDVVLNCSICGSTCSDYECPFKDKCPDPYGRGVVDKDFVKWLESEVDANE